MEARGLDRRFFRNYKGSRWIGDVITQRANIELMIIDPYWSRLDYPTAYRFQTLVTPSLCRSCRQDMIQRQVTSEVPCVRTQSEICVFPQLRTRLDESRVRV